ncbi:MAG TPA: hypothetical protein VFH94_26405 [Streptomyces sp.]|nr:hypothetical protein [Streptomyces sp.]
MGSSREQGSAGRAEHVCPACKQPVRTVVKRRKSLGVFVPVWGPGPCRNPACGQRAEEPEGESETRP